MNVDLHSHFFALEAFQKAQQFRQHAPEITLTDGQYSVSCPGGSRGNLGEGAYNVEARVRELDKMQIDFQAISPSPILLFYWDLADPAAYFSRLQNEAIQQAVESRPDRFVGFGTVPLQSIPEAIAITKEAHQLGLKGLEVGTHIQGKPLDDPSLEPFYAAAQELDLLLFVHPIEGGDPPETLTSGILGNVLGFPYKTTLMIERMILKGIFERFPNLRLCLAHGGGYLPFNIWRLDHAHTLRGDLRKLAPQKPSAYLKKMYYDSIVHSVVALQFLVQVVGADRVVIGTDFPMGMGDKEPVSKIKSMNTVTSEEQEQILGGNALRALGIDDRPK